MVSVVVGVVVGVVSGGVVRRGNSGCYYLWANSFHGWSSIFNDVSGLNNVLAWAFETCILGSCCIKTLTPFLFRYLAITHIALY